MIAAERRTQASKGSTKLLSTVVEDRDRTAFLATGRAGVERRRVKTVKSGELWIGLLDELWEHLERYPRLDLVADVYRGLQWKEQRAGVSKKPRKGFARGVFKPADSLLQFEINNIVFLDMDPATAKYPGPLTRPWDKPKVLANVARLSRGPWRIAAAYDASGLVASQGFFGIWPTDASVPLEALEAIVNSPLSNAFLAEHASNKHITNELLKRLPIPDFRRLESLQMAVIRYRDALAAYRQSVLQGVDSEAILNRLLVEIDAEVLRAYDLPPRLGAGSWNSFEDMRKSVG